MKTLLWVAAGAIPVIAVLVFFLTQHIAAVGMTIFIAIASVAVMSQRTRTEIDLENREIRTTREVFALTLRKAYRLVDFTTAEIQVKHRLIEGYSLPLFFVHLVGRGKQFALYSTDDEKEAKAVQEEITVFLGKAGVSTPRGQSG